MPNTRNLSFSWEPPYDNSSETKLWSSLKATYALKTWVIVLHLCFPGFCWFVCWSEEHGKVYSVQSSSNFPSLKKECLGSWQAEKDRGCGRRKKKGVSDIEVLFKTSSVPQAHIDVDVWTTLADNLINLWKFFSHDVPAISVYILTLSRGYLLQNP